MKITLSFDELIVTREGMDAEGDSIYCAHITVRNDKHGICVTGTGTASDMTRAIEKATNDMTDKCKAIPGAWLEL